MTVPVVKRGTTEATATGAGRAELTVVATADPLTRMALVVDPGSLVPDPERAGSGVRSGVGEVGGLPVGLFACDPRVRGGALGEVGCGVIVDAVRRAAVEARALVAIWHSGGARLQDGTSSLDGVGRVFHALVTARGRVPLISVVLGPSAGGAAYGPALTDIVVAGPDARIFVTGPTVVRAVIGERVDAAGLGGPDVHARHSGVLHRDEGTEDGALLRARELVSLLTRVDRPEPLPGPAPALAHALPRSSRQTYDVGLLVEDLLDAGTMVTLHPRWAQNVLTAVGRLGGTSVGVLANNPWHLAGCLDCAASEKAAAFVDRCDGWGLPLVVLADVPGYLPGSDQESGGIVARGARLLDSFARAGVPRVTVILRKAYGGAFIAMNSRALGATAVYAWPTAEVGVMDAVGAVEILHHKRLAACPPEGRHLLVARLAAEYQDGAGGLDRAVALGHVDAVIDPSETRRVLAETIRVARTAGHASSAAPRAVAVAAGRDRRGAAG